MMRLWPFVRRLRNALFPRPLPFNAAGVEHILGYHFNDQSLLFESLKHRSYSQTVYGTTARSYERLEFLGDSVLSAIVSHRIFLENPGHQEGELTRLRSNLVSSTFEAVVCRKIGLDRFVLLDGSEENAGGRNRTSIITDMFEAVIGAIFLDGGYKAAEDFIDRTIFRFQDELLDVMVNYKSILLELVQAEKRGCPEYRTVSESGPDHDKVFVIEVRVDGEPIGTGTGKTKKAAEQVAAQNGLDAFVKRLKDR